MAKNKPFYYATNFMEAKIDKTHKMYNRTSFPVDDVSDICHQKRKTVIREKRRKDLQFHGR